MYIRVVQGRKSQPRKPKMKLPNAPLTYTGLIRYQTRTARRGPTNNKAVKKQHIFFSPLIIKIS
jgi:hypothetical protein